MKRFYGDLIRRLRRHLPQRGKAFCNIAPAGYTQADNLAVLPADLPQSPTAPAPSHRSAFFSSQRPMGVPERVPNGDGLFRALGHALGCRPLAVTTKSLLLREKYLQADWTAAAVDEELAFSCGRNICKQIGPQSVLCTRAVGEVPIQPL